MIEFSDSSIIFPFHDSEVSSPRFQVQMLWKGLEGAEGNPSWIFQISNGSVAEKSEIPWRDLKMVGANKYHGKVVQQDVLGCSWRQGYSEQRDTPGKALQGGATNG